MEVHCCPQDVQFLINISPPSKDTVGKKLKNSAIKEKLCWILLDWNRNSKKSMFQNMLIVRKQSVQLIPRLIFHQTLSHCVQEHAYNKGTNGYFLVSVQPRVIWTKCLSSVFLKFKRLRRYTLFSLFFFVLKNISKKVLFCHFLHKNGAEHFWRLLHTVWCESMAAESNLRNKLLGWPLRIDRKNFPL